MCSTADRLKLTNYVCYSRQFNTHTICAYSRNFNAYTICSVQNTV